MAAAVPPAAHGKVCHPLVATTGRATHHYCMAHGCLGTALGTVLGGGLVPQLAAACEMQDITSPPPRTSTACCVPGFTVPGCAPLCACLPHRALQIARVLLAYGADINVEDKSGKKARDVSGLDGELGTGTGSGPWATLL